MFVAESGSRLALETVEALRATSAESPDTRNATLLEKGGEDARSVGAGNRESDQSVACGRFRSAGPDNINQIIGAWTDLSGTDGVLLVVFVAVSSALPTTRAVAVVRIESPLALNEHKYHTAIFSRGV